MQYVNLYLYEILAHNVYIIKYPVYAGVQIDQVPLIAGTTAYSVLFGYIYTYICII